jgi:hypothetical protein
MHLPATRILAPMHLSLCPSIGVVGVAILLTWAGAALGLDPIINTGEPTFLHQGDQLHLMPYISLPPDRQPVQCNWLIGTDQIRIFGPPAPLDYIFSTTCPVSLSVTDSQGGSYTSAPLDVQVSPVTSLPSPDLDGDSDVDLDDFGQLQRCYTGPGVQQLDPDCAGTDLTGDGFVDEQDLARLQACATSAGVPAAPECLPAAPLGETFTRASIACSGDGSGIHDYASSERRYDDLLTTNDSDGATVTGEADGQDLYPLNSNSRYIFGYSRSKKRLYRSVDGLNWTGFGPTNDTDLPYSLVIIPEGPHADRVIRFTSTSIGSDTLSETPVYDGSALSTVHTTSSVFTSIMQGYVVWFNSSSAWFKISEVISPTQVTVVGDASAQIPGQQISVKDMAPRYSDDDGDTWQEGMDANGTPFAIGRGSIIRDWNWRYENGVLIVGDYNYPPTRLMRSADDGVTWATVFTKRNPGDFDHFHAIGYHPQIGSSGRWIANTGDGTGKNHDFISDDNGLTWSDFQTGKQAPDCQTVRYLYDGDPTRLLVGSDDVGGLAWMDLSNWRWGWFSGFRWTSGSQYCSVLFKSDGVYYAAQTLNSASGMPVVISVSPDLKHWTVYHRLMDTAATGFKAYCGRKGGKLHFSYYSNGYPKHFAISPAQVALKAGLQVAPATTNMVSEALSGFETLSGIFVPRSDPGGYNLDSAIKYSGNYSLHVKKTGGYAQIMIPITNYASWTKTLRARVRARGTGQWFNLYWYKLAGGPPSPDEWCEYVSPSQTIDPYQTVNLYFAAYPETATGNAEMWLDSLQLEETPGAAWQPGGTSRSSEVLERRVRLATQWTHVFSIRCDVDNNWLLSPKLYYLMTYQANTAPDSHLDVYFDSSSQSLNLGLTVNGVPQGTVATLPTWFYRDSRLRVAVRHAADGYHLSLLNAGAPQHVSAVLPDSAWIYGNVTARTGAVDGGSVLPLTLYESTFYQTALSDEQIFAPPAP